MVIKKTKSLPQKFEVSLSFVHQADFVSLNEMARGFEDELQLIDSWISCKETLDFLNVWELNNNAENFNTNAFDKIRSEISSHQIKMSVQKWIDQTHAIGVAIRMKPDTAIYAHPDIAFEFGTWLNPKFKLYIIKEFQRLKGIERPSQSVGWQARRELAKINYRLQVNAIKQNLVDRVDPARKRFVYANEADLLNRVVFGETRRQWHKAHPELVGNQRDYASTLDTAILANLEVTNAALIERGLTQQQRYYALMNTANKLRSVLQHSPTILKIDRENPLRQEVKLLQ